MEKIPQYSNMVLFHISALKQAHPNNSGYSRPALQAKIDSYNRYSNLNVICVPEWNNT